MNDLTEPAGIAALSAGALAFIALLLAIVLAFRVRKLRAAQKAVLGESGQTDLVAHAAGLQQAFNALHERVEEVATTVDQRLGVAEARLDGAIAYRSLVRYDAYGELTGNQSTTIALLDAERNGVVMSSIVRRDTARIYCKLVHRRPGRAPALARGDRGRAARPRRRRRRHAAGMRVGFLGPAGTYSQEAVFAGPGTENYEPVPLPSVHDAVMAVHEGRVERALVPIENSLEGAVNATLDTLAFETEDVQIAGELVLPIHHCLIARDPVELERIVAVTSHPQASGQCATFLRTRLPDAAVVDAASTADAVRIVAEREGGEPWAALGQPRGGGALRLRGAGLRRRGPAGLADALRVDRPRGAGSLRSAGAWKTALMFWEPSDDRAGWLVRCLAEFADRDVNLTRIESRPRRQGLGTYMFFVDLNGRADDAAVAEAIGALRSHAEACGCSGRSRLRRNQRQPRRSNTHLRTVRRSLGPGGRTHAIVTVPRRSATPPTASTLARTSGS